MRDIRILPVVLPDLDKAATWYDRHGYEGLGERFIEAFYAALPHIQVQGEIYRIVYQGFRRILIRPFPYSVYYGMHGGEWIVTLVIHTARRPSLTKGLLRRRNQLDL